MKALKNFILSLRHKKIRLETYFHQCIALYVYYSEFIYGTEAIMITKSV